MSRARRPPRNPPGASYAARTNELTSPTSPTSPTNPTNPTSPTSPTSSTWLRAAATFVTLEGAGLVAVSILYGASVRDEGHGVSAWGAAIVGVAFGASIVGVLARALARGSRRAVAPTVLLQLICIGEAYNMTQEQRFLYAVIVGVLAGCALVATAIAVRRLPTDRD